MWFGGFKKICILSSRAKFDMATNRNPSLFYVNFPLELDKGSKSFLGTLVSDTQDNCRMIADMIVLTLREKIESKEISDDDRIAKVNFHLSAFGLVVRTKATWLPEVNISTCYKRILGDTKDFQPELRQQAFQDQNLPRCVDRNSKILSLFGRGNLPDNVQRRQ